MLDKKDQDRKKGAFVFDILGILLINLLLLPPLLIIDFPVSAKMTIAIVVSICYALYLNFLIGIASTVLWIWAIVVIIGRIF